MYLPKNRNLKSYARELRKEAAKEENHLWYDYLKNYPVQFYRQHIIGDYIADFYCKKVKLIVEITALQI